MFGKNKAKRKINWALLTNPMCTELNFSTQLHSQLAQCQSPVYQEKMLPCDRRIAGWHMNCLLPPLTTYQWGPGNAPCAPPPRSHILLLSTTSTSPRHSLMQTETRTQHRCDEEIARQIGRGPRSLRRSQDGVLRQKSSDIFWRAFFGRGISGEALLVYYFVPVNWLWSGFINPRIRTFVKKRFHGLFSKKKRSKSGGVPSFPRREHVPAVISLPRRQGSALDPFHEIT